jgi:DNA-binding MarR family transcriptional regulator
LDDDEQRTWRAWLNMTELVKTQLGRDLLADAGLSDPDFAVLVHLSERPEHRMRMSDLAEGLRWSKSRLSHQVSRMERRGLVERQGCPSDARGFFAQLTAAGLAEIRRAAPLHVMRVRRRFLDVLDREQLAQLGAICDLVIDHLRDTGDADLTATSPPPCPRDDAEPARQASSAL